MTTIKQITSYNKLEDFGRVRLSKNYYVRDFLYSEISNFHAVPNIPVNPELFIKAGSKLCETILEPLKETFGHISIRSAYRSPKVNECGNKNKLNCASNESNYAGHIWDIKDKEGYIGATVCIFIPWFNDNFKEERDWLKLAYFLYDNIEFSKVTFFAKQNCFNISYHEKKKNKTIYSYKSPKGYLIDGKSNKSLPDDIDIKDMYKEITEKLKSN